MFASLLYFPMRELFLDGFSSAGDETFEFTLDFAGDSGGSSWFMMYIVGITFIPEVNNRVQINSFLKSTGYASSTTLYTPLNNGTCNPPNQE